MITERLDVAVSAAGGACALIFLFEGARRLKVGGVHRTALVMTAFGAIFCISHAGFSYWKSVALSGMGQAHQQKMFADELPADWGKQLDPEKREESSVAMARIAFVDSGRLRAYIDRAGERKRYSPTEEDFKNRDLAVVTQARVEYAVRINLGEALSWLILGSVAALFGFGIAHDRHASRQGC